MRLYIIIILLGTISFGSFAQQDSLNYTPRDTAINQPAAPMTLLDSVAAASAARQQFVSDSLAIAFIKFPDPGRPNQFVEQMMREQVYTGHGFLDITAPAKKNQGTGIARKTRDNWVIGVVIFILLYAGFLRLTVTKDISNILQALYSKQLFSKADDDSSLLSSWAFLGLLLLMGLTFGLFLYQVSGYYQVYYPVGGSALFVSLCILVILLFSLKLLILKFLGFVFHLNSVVDRYIAVLCFTYFAITFILLPVIACFSLITAQLVPGIFLIAMLLSGAILVWLYLRNSIIIISNFRFSKFYLFVYLCALEICPILILIKALNI